MQSMIQSQLHYPDLGESFTYSECMHTIREEFSSDYLAFIYSHYLILWEVERHFSDFTEKPQIKSEVERHSSDFYEKPQTKSAR